MAKEETLTRIEQEITTGDLGKARDRLHGLITAFPDDLSLRRQLGDIYDRLQFPSMAGRYWYLEEKKTPDMLAACNLFEQTCGNDPLQILRSIKFKGDPDEIENEFAAKRLQSLQKRASAEYGFTVDFSRPGAEKYQPTRKNRFVSALSKLGCLVVVLAALALLVVGVIATYQWFF
ncbi:MAG: hypothetical protein JXA42_14330 [Anaerolineales bacterium]|nr:hypothetical protein [Anaerolineales bacterium]